MSKLLSTPYFSFNSKEVTRKSFSEQICDDNIFSLKVARPLFERGLLAAAITERFNYDSGFFCHRDFHSFYLQLQGTMKITLNDRKKDIGAGELTWIPAGCKFRRSSKGTTWWLYFQIDNTNHWEPLKEAGAYIRDYENAALMFLLLRKILDAQNSGSAEAATIALDSARYLVDLLNHEMTLMTRGVSVHAIALQRLMDEIARQPQMNWTIKEMSERTVLSRSHLYNLFRKEYGMSPMDAVIKQRMRHAIHLLVHDKDSVESIAMASGYESACSFTRLFTKHVGMSPGQYRKEYQGKGIPS